MRAYPVELRQRAAEAYLNGEGSLREVGERFAVSREFVRRMAALSLRQGHVRPAPHAGGRFKLGAAGETALERLVEQKPDATLAELGARLRKERSVAMTPSGIHRALARLRVTYKKSRSMQRSRTGRTSTPVGSPFVGGPGAGIRASSSSSTNLA